MSLRARAVEQPVTLPDGRSGIVWVGVPDDPYVAKRDLDTVQLELRFGDEVAASLPTVLDADQESEARSLARDVAGRLQSGELPPTAGALEPFAAELR